MLKREGYKAINIMHIFSRLYGVTGPGTIKRCLCVLIVVAGLGTLEQISLSQKVQQKSWLLTSISPIFHPHFSDNLIQQEKYVLEKDDFAIEGPRIFRSQISRELFSIANIKLLTYPLNSHWRILFDAIKHSPYILFFASLPLRSPPLFS